MDIKLHTKKFGEIFYKIDEDDLHIIQNHKIYACKLKNDKLYLIGNLITFFYAVYLHS